MTRSLGNLLYQLVEGVLIAFDAIRTNKVRAGLTILGIAVGVLVVTVMTAAVHGINAGVSRSLAAAGPTTFFISRWPAEFQACDGGGESCPWIRFRPLTLDQGREVAQLPMIQGVSADIESSASVKYADRELPGVQLIGYSTNWFEMAGGDISVGRNFTESEYETASPVVLVNDKVVERLFNGEEAIGKELRLNGQLFTVIGVYNPIPNVFDSGDKGKLIVPITTAQRRLNVSLYWMQLTVKPREGIDRDAAMDETIATLRASRHLRPGQTNDFFTNTPEKFLALYNKIVGVFLIVMIALSAVGLLVGGVGVVAIMMISVTERTREIGVRKALGATRRAILWQFLVEAATLTTVGAIIGLLVGGGITTLIRSFTPIDASTPPIAIVAALASSALAGIAFGVLPAFRASRLDPVEALRYE
ncbi:MAG TPA: ABC transporter permease [Gemmatimonadaceae bacterium]|nr:ABC transporter permease [Gemmatimonadaceae bacterium]